MGSIIGSMVVDMNDTKLSTLEPLRRFLVGTALVLSGVEGEVVFQPGLRRRAVRLRSRRAVRLRSRQAVRAHCPGIAAFPVPSATTRGQGGGRALSGLVLSGAEGTDNGLFTSAADSAHRPVPGRPPDQEALSTAAGGLHPDLYRGRRFGSAHRPASFPERSRRAARPPVC